MTKINPVSIPYVDPNVQHVGISRLRALSVAQLRDLDKTLGRGRSKALWISNRTTTEFSA